jgi:hypothetical protein
MIQDGCHAMLAAAVIGFSLISDDGFREKCILLFIHV